MLLPRDALATRPGALAALTPWIRAISGLTFVVFGIGKFTAHAAEARAFERYGLPSPDALTSVIGVLEVGGGLMLLAGALTRLAAVLMAGNMVVAIALSGIGQGEVLPSLTVAPLLLAGMVVLLWVGPGSGSIDGRLLSRGPSS